MPLGDPPFDHRLLGGLGQQQQAHGVGDGDAALPDLQSHVGLREPEVLGEALIGLRLLQRVQVGALQVFDQRQLQRLPVETSLTTTGTRSRPAIFAARQRRSPTMMR